MADELDILKRRFDELLADNKRMIWSACRRHSYHYGGEADDLMQDVLLALWMHMGQLRPDAGAAQARAWVWWKMRTVLYDYRRGLKRAALPLVEEDDVAAPQEEADHAETVAELMASLDSEQQHLLRLRLEGYSLKEIAGLAGLSPEAVKQRFYRMRIKLREQHANQTKAR